MLHPIFFQNQKLYTINGFNFKLRTSLNKFVTFCESEKGSFNSVTKHEKTKHERYT